MDRKRTSRWSQPRDEAANRLLLLAGTVYGVMFGLSFGLFTWGYDALRLASSAADLAWAKLLIGLPLTAVIGGLAGRVAASSPSTARSVTLWAGVGVLLGLIAGHMPFEGNNLAAWLLDRRLRWLVVFPFGSSAAARTTLVAGIGAGVGALGGVIESLATGWAWDWARPDGRMSVRSWAALLACLPLALFLAWAADDLINQPMRIPQQSVGELVALVQAGAREEAERRGLNYTSLGFHRHRFSERYTIYLADYDPDTHAMVHVDVVFDNGFALRCLSVEGSVGYCGPISDKYRDWMDDLIHAGLSGEQRWLSSGSSALAVDDTAVAWLGQHSHRLDEPYEVTRAGQRGTWVFMSARFDDGFEMVCRFRGSGSVLVDECAEE